MTPAKTRLAVVAGSLLLAAAVRLPGLDTRGLASGGQLAFVESQGFAAHAALPVDRPVDPRSLPRRASLLEVARGATVPPAHAAGLGAWTRLAGTSEGALRLPSAVAGALAAALAAFAGCALSGARAGAWAGALVALSPIHVLASREAGPEAPLVAVLLLAIALAARSAERRGAVAAVLVGGGVGLLATSGVAALAAASVVPLAWLAARPGRRREAAGALASGVTVVAVLVLLGAARSPLDPGEIPSWIPEATAAGILRCTGASFTRVAGLEYHLAVPHARFVLPLTALLVALMGLGAARLAPADRWALVAGAVLPFAVGAALALASGRVLPLQAARLVAALPCMALLSAAGLASLRGRRAWAASAAVGGGTAVFLLLALARPGYETSPTRATALEIAACRAPGTVVAAQRPLDLLALAAWGVPGPLALRAPAASPPAGPAVLAGPALTCVVETACGAFPPCPAD